MIMHIHIILPSMKQSLPALRNKGSQSLFRSSTEAHLEQYLPFRLKNLHFDVLHYHQKEYQSYAPEQNNSHPTTSLKQSVLKQLNCLSLQSKSITKQQLLVRAKKMHNRYYKFDSFLQHSSKPQRSLYHKQNNSQIFPSIKHSLPELYLKK